MNNYFLCPVCSDKLFADESGKSLLCKKRHTFDISSKGYVNLLVNTKNKNTIHGDDKEMVNARRDFLNKGYYQPLCEEICSIVSDNAVNGSVIVDAGCGECYYTSSVHSSLKSSNKKCDIIGIDISKDALMVGSRRCKDISLAVGSVFRLPLENEMCDILLTIFSPYSDAEYKRVLKKSGKMLMVFPLENHLFSLKEAVYDEPYKNSPKDYALDGFNLISTREIKYEINLDCNDDIKNLFSMTPYYFKTSPTDKKKLDAVSSLTTSVEFCIALYEKV